MKRTITLVIVLFFSTLQAGYSQCSQSFESAETLVVSGVESGADHYYRNLIIQDLALASQQAFGDISLTFDYKVFFSTDACKNNGAEIKILPLELTSRQVLYREYDVSPALVPEKAQLAFSLVNDHGMVFDSLVLHDIPVNAESALYTTLSTGEEQPVDFTVELSNVRFYFTKISYERFRDIILEIDAYYAASILADSALAWAGSGFLSENAPGHELIMRQLELQRIIHYIDPSSFKDILEQKAGDIENVSGKFKDLQKAARRLNAIISYNQIPKAFPAGKSGAVKLFIDWLEYYYRFADRADFHYTDFLRKQALPEFRNGRLAYVYELFSEQFGMSPKTGQSAAYLLASDLQNMGSRYESVGDYQRALNYFGLADKLAKRVYLPGAGTRALSAMARMKDSLAFAYLNISARSALASNPSMAAAYFYKAKDIYEDHGYASEPAWVTDHRIRLSTDFESQAERLVNEKSYRKAMAYLVEIQNFCRQESDYHCPDMLRTWMQLTRQGLYLEILYKAKSLADRDEYTEAGDLYRQAVSMRMGNGYAIGKDIIETNLELRFRQVRFDELYEEGLRFYRIGDYIAALYYFNKAGNLSRMGLLKQEPGLMDIRLEAGRQVIMQNLSEGRVKAWAHDFEGALFICNHIENLISEYELPYYDCLVVQFENLQSEIKQKKCSTIQTDYDKLMDEIPDAAKTGDFIRAHDLAAKAVELSMDNLECGIHDSEAWYQKVVLETPADYQRQERALNALAAKSWNLYLEGFEELRKYHQKQKLLNQGIAFTPLLKRVMQINDTTFLSGMLSYFIRVRNYDHALEVLHKLHELRMPAESVAADQKALARYYAEYDAVNKKDEKAWDLLNNYAKKDKWYHDFRKSYKSTYMKAVNWKFRYWPFLWKK